MYVFFPSFSRVYFNYLSLKKGSYTYYCFIVGENTIFCIENWKKILLEVNNFFNTFFYSYDI